MAAAFATGIGMAADTRQIVKEVVVPAPAGEVWRVWTTTEGAKEFFARDAKIELEPGGAYEMYFNPAAAPGERGGEGCRVMAIQPESSLLFSWNAPPRFPEIRKERTWVLVQLHPEGDRSTRVRLTHFGWGSGEKWDEVYDYFAGAWNIVTGRLVERFEKGKVEWK